MSAVEAVASTLRLTEEQKQVLLEQLDKLDEDPVLILKIRDAWVAPQNLSVTPDDILDDIATWESPNCRRDHWAGATHWLFHFKVVVEIADCRRHILQNHPYSFGDSQDLIDLGLAPAAAAANIFADAMVINKIAIKDDDVFEYRFFN